MFIEHKSFHTNVFNDHEKKRLITSIIFSRVIMIIISSIAYVIFLLQNIQNFMCFLITCAIQSHLQDRTKKETINMHQQKYIISFIFVNPR